MSDQEQVQQADQPVEKGESQGLSLEAAGDLASSSMMMQKYYVSGVTGGAVKG